MSFISNIFSQSYESLWKSVTDAQRKDFPKEIIKNAEQIYDKALKEKCYPQMMKAWITIIETKSDLDPDSFRIENFPPIPHEKPAEAAIYNAVMGAAYLVMRDTYITENDEETKQQYLDNAEACFAAALCDQETLANTLAEDYKPLTTKELDSKYYNHDLLSLITNFIITHGERTNAQMADLCAAAADYYKQHERMDAWTLMTLQKLSFLQNHEDYNVRSVATRNYSDELKKMVEETKDFDTGVDVAIAYLDQLHNEDERIEFARWAKTQYSKTDRTTYFKSIERSIMAPSLSITMESNALADRPLGLYLYAQNETEGSLEVRQYNGMDKNRNLKTDGKLVLQRDYQFCQDSVMTERRSKHLPIHDNLRDTIVLPTGHYVYVLKGNGNTSVQEASITSLRLLSFTLPADQMLLLVLNNETGRPVSNATIKLSDYQDKEQDTFDCDNNGEVIINTKNKNYRYAVAYIKGTDDKTSNVNISTYGPSSSKEEVNYHTQLFTDRGIYRPGQTVHVSGIVYKQLKDETEVAPNIHKNISMRDANYRNVAKQEVCSNDMGTYDTDFVLPKDVMPGRFTITDGSTTISINVEEYKRPTFQVDAHLAMGNNQDENFSFSFGDTIQVEAVTKTFSGVPVQGATVRYKIQTAEVDFWRWYNTNWDTMSSGEIDTDDEGKASVSVFLDPKKLQDPDYGLVRYQVTFDITDQAGETRSDSYSLSLSRRSFSLNIKMNNEIDLSNNQENSFVIDAINASRKPVTINGTYSIVCTADDKEIIVQNQPFTSGQGLQLPKSLAPGSYKIVAQALDRNEIEIEAENNFLVYASNLAISFPSLKSAKGTSTYSTRFNKDFFHQSSTYFSEQKDAEVLFSPCKEDVRVGYMILTNDKVVNRGDVIIGRQQYRLSIPYDKKYGDGISVLLWYVRNGDLCQQYLQYQYQKPDKRLDLSWSTFRDKLYPGQDEEWTLTIRNHDGQPVAGAELLATMYDASLDELTSNNFLFSVGFNRYVYRWSHFHSYENSGHSLRYQGNTYIQRDGVRHFDELKEFIHDRYSHRYDNAILYSTTGSRGRGRSMVNMVESCSMDNIVALEDNMAAMPMAKMAMVEEEAETEEIVAVDATEEETETKQVALRSNFAETAFFYPHLLSDKNGEVKISFTLPESLTEWKFMGLAHTANVDYGYITAKTIARKDFMVQPNMPRFVREGDKAVIATRIINQCDHALSGEAQIRLIDPETEQLVHSASVPFNVDSEKTTSVSFDVDITDQYPMLICEVVALSGNFSDGERNYLPVLSSKKYITEAIPFYITREESEKHIDLTEIFNEQSPSATHRRMLLEFTERPEWTVIEALEGIKLPEHDNAPCFAAALYSNTMAQRLAQSIPGFEKALLYAKEHNIDATSQLDENQDLKDIVSAESPWIRDALAEAEQRQRLLELFDSQLMAKRIETAKTKLQKLQLGDGSWTWFEGMSGNYYITLSTCHSLALLQSDDADVKKMLSMGLKYLDEKELEYYKDRVKHKYSLNPNSSTIDYLYIWSLMPEREVSKELKKMRETYLKRLQENVRNLTIQGRSNAAVILRAFGHTKPADDFLESAVQYTITKPGMGRYYATDAAYYSWRDYRIPTQLATMQALRMSTRADRLPLLREMQIWLLRQKQTQTWDNPLNTIAAVDFLLHEGDGMTPSAEVGQVTFRIDDNVLPAQLDTTRFLAPELGYIRAQVDKAITQQPHQELVVAKSTADPASLEQSPVISWGALYTQYLEEMDRLKQQTSGELKVSVKLIVENAPKGDNIPELHVGDKVTLRVILTADRDMDFVQVRMQRPACFEPDNQTSGYRWMNGRGGYVAQRDASTDIFFDTFRKGTMTYDIDYHVDREGTYLTGVTTAQCAYAPEFVAHTSALHITVK